MVNAKQYKCYPYITFYVLNPSIFSVVYNFCRCSLKLVFSKIKVKYVDIVQFLKIIKIKLNIKKII